MKLAEALMERAELQKRISQLKVKWTHWSRQYLIEFKMVANHTQLIGAAPG